MFHHGKRNVGNMRTTERGRCGKSFSIDQKNNSSLAVKYIVLLPWILLISECNHNRFSHKYIQSLPVILFIKNFLFEWQILITRSSSACIKSFHFKEVLHWYEKSLWRNILVIGKHTSFDCSVAFLQKYYSIAYRAHNCHQALARCIYLICYWSTMSLNEPQLLHASVFPSVKTQFLRSISQAGEGSR